MVEKHAQDNVDFQRRIFLNLGLCINWHCLGLRRAFLQYGEADNGENQLKVSALKVDAFLAKSCPVLKLIAPKKPTF